MNRARQPLHMNQPSRIRQDTTRAEKKGQPSMSEPTAPEFNQIRVITALLDLAQEDAPSIQWRIADDTQLGYAVMAHLEGHILTGTDTERRHGLAAWQRVIGAGPVEVRDAGPREHLHIRGSYHGVSVEVVTIVDACCAHCQGHDVEAGEAA